MELLLKCGADIDAVNTAGLTPSDVTEWDGLAQQDGPYAASAAVATGTNMQETSGVTSLSGAASSTDSAATPAAAAGGEGEAGSSAEAAKGSLVCPKCARVYVYQFRSASQQQQREQRQPHGVFSSAEAVHPARHSCSHSIFS